jgi:hypothetical protein
MLVSEASPRPWNPDRIRTPPDTLASERIFNLLASGSPKGSETPRFKSGKGLLGAIFLSVSRLRAKQHRRPQPMRKASAAERCRLGGRAAKVAETVFLGSKNGTICMEGRVTLCQIGRQSRRLATMDRSAVSLSGHQTQNLPDSAPPPSFAGTGPEHIQCQSNRRLTVKQT